MGKTRAVSALTVTHTPVGWAGPAASAFLRVLSIRQVMAPGVPTCTLELDLAAIFVATGYKKWPWDKGGFIRRDDRIRVTVPTAAPNVLECLFNGTVLEVDWSSSMSSGTVLVTCSGLAHAYSRGTDYQIVGRQMYYYYGVGETFKSPVLATGIPCSFNAGGWPNKHPVNADVAARVPTLSGGLPIFTYDGDPNAQPWTALDILRYLMFGVAWLNEIAYPFDAVDWTSEYVGDRPDPIVLDCEGMSIWAALGALADKAGLDIWERFFLEEDNNPGSALSMLWVQGRSAGPTKTFSRQVTGASLDLDLTNLHACRVVESSTNCLTRPVLAGGAQLYEIRVELSQAWDPTLLSNPDDDISYDAVGEVDAASTYQKRYIPGGVDFFDYRDVGRLWIADTAAEYQNVADGFVLPLVRLHTIEGMNLPEENPPVWPRMRYKPLPRLTGMNLPGKCSSQYKIELQMSEGGEVFDITAHCQVLPDRLGVRVTTPNLTSVYPVEPSDTDAQDYKRFEANLFESLLADASKVKMWLTCTVASGSRHVYRPAYHASLAGTSLHTGEVFNRGSQGGYGLITASAAGVAEVRYDERTALESHGNALQQAYEGATVAAQIAVEWIELGYALGDRITGITGIGEAGGTYSLASGGEGSRFPRIVGITFLPTAQTWCTQYHLDEDRWLPPAGQSR
jgi:hypothetical protein